MMMIDVVQKREQPLGFIEKLLQDDGMLFLRAYASLREFEQVFRAADVAFQLMRQCMRHACQTRRSRGD